MATPKQFRVSLEPAEPGVYGKDAWHLMNPDGTRFTTIGGRQIAEQRAKRRETTLKGAATKRANKENA